jgi:hypothetical protein
MASQTIVSLGLNEFEHFTGTPIFALIMTKITVSALMAAAMLIASPVFAGGKACCAKGASNEKVACASFASLHLTADQKSKIDAWQAECIKAGCTKESRAKFLKQAKGILSAEQYAKLKEKCNMPVKKA